MLRRTIVKTLRIPKMSYSTSTPHIVSSEDAGPIEKSIIDKIVTGLDPTSLTVANDSYKHAHHAGIRGASNKTESHFKLDIVSEAFEGKNLPARHRLVYHLLDEEFQLKGLHALQMKTKTLAETKK